jgi:hypothetical protein
LQIIIGVQTNNPKNPTVLTLYLHPQERSNKSIKFNILNNILINTKTQITSQRSVKLAYKSVQQDPPNKKLVRALIIFIRNKITPCNLRSPTNRTLR